MKRRAFETALLIVAYALILFTVYSLSGCGGADPVFSAPRVDFAIDGEEGSPATPEGCRRDFCPTAWPKHVARTEKVCECVCVGRRFSRLAVPASDSRRFDPAGAARRLAQVLPRAGG